MLYNIEAELLQKLKHYSITYDTQTNGFTGIHGWIETISIPIFRINESTLFVFIHS